MPSEPVPPASTPQLRIHPRALLDIKQISDLSVHAAGGHFAFVAAEPDYEDSRWISHVWLTEWPEQATDENSSVDDGQEDAPPPGPEELTRQLTYSHEGERLPRWSPDGVWLAFLSARLDTTAKPDEDDEDEPKEQLWLLPTEGGEARALTSGTESVLDYQWAPDSSGVYYMVDMPRPAPLHSARRERHRLRFDPVVEREDVRPRQIWFIAPGAARPRLVATLDPGLQEFTVSPDGARICYATNYTGEWNDYHQVDLWILDTSSGKRRLLFRRGGGTYRPRWSSDGSIVACLAWLDPSLSYSRLSLYRASVQADIDWNDSQEPVSTAHAAAPDDFDVEITEFEWVPESDEIIAIGAIGTATTLFQIRAGERPVELPLAQGRTRCCLQVSADPRRIAWIEESAESPDEVVMVDAEGAEHRLTGVNSIFAETFVLPRQEVVRWNSSDGAAVEGVLVYPPDYDPARRYPLIVQIHGGPKSRSTNTLTSYYMHPLWAAEGYLVLQPNFRGSEGYGAEFAVASRRDLGGKDFEDIVAGVDWCIERGLADSARLGIMGGSYGGYMTNWAIAHTDRFKAAVSMFGIFHLQTDYSNSDLSRWDLEYLGAHYWEDAEIYRRLSPGSYLENIKTPTLIIHGEDDTNTTLANSREMYRALRQRGVTVEFARYPREGHGLREPNHRIDEMRRCLNWMDRFVKHSDDRPDARVGDTIPSGDGSLELNVGPVSIIDISSSGPSNTMLDRQAIEITFTISSPPNGSREAISVTVDDFRLRVAEPIAVAGDYLPAGVPLSVGGSKVIVRGENLHFTQIRSPDTGDLAAAGAIAFPMAAHAGTGELYVPGFRPVRIYWSGTEEETADGAEEAEDRT